MHGHSARRDPPVWPSIFLSFNPYFNEPISSNDIAEARGYLCRLAEVQGWLGVGEAIVLRKLAYKVAVLEERNGGDGG